jgi:dipeptidyl aminopeptidase/acylaminoacyl peptidase
LTLRLGFSSFLQAVEPVSKMKSNFLDLEMLLSIPYVDPDLGFDISADGKKIAFSWNHTGHWEIYSLELCAGANTSEVSDIIQANQPQQITRGQGGKFSPRWRPQRNQLAYAIDLDGGENYDIYLCDLESGKHTNLTPNTDYAIMPSYTWSPDGEWLACCSDQDGRFDTYIVPVDGGSCQKVLDCPFPDWEVKWSPDGRHLAVVSEAEGQDYRITIVPILIGDPFTILVDGNPICAKDPCWSQDGSLLAFSSNLNGNYEIAIFNIDLRVITWITSGEGEKEQPDWANSRSLAYVQSRGPSCELVIQNLDHHKLSIHQIAPGVIYTPKFDPSGSQVYFMFDNPQYPGDIWSFSLVDQRFVQLTTSVPEGFELKGLVIPEEIWYPSIDGVNVPALLYRPKEKNVAHSKTPDRLPPGVISIHGGPNWLARVTWDPLVQHMVSRGWVVLTPNYRGSTGYGRGWQLANRFDLGGVDTEDVVAGLEYITRENLANPEKIAVTGRSWGGYLTMTCLSRFPHKWTAGSAVVPFLNWFTAHKNSRKDLQHWDLQNFGDPSTHYDLWYKRSPFFFLDQIQAPVQLICGAHDIRCPASESLNAYEKLLRLGKEAEYILYPDEGHSFLNKKNLVRSKKQQVDFLASHLESE